MAEFPAEGGGCGAENRVTSTSATSQRVKRADQLGYEPNKIKLVLNRADSSLGIRVADVESSIGRKVDHILADPRVTRGRRTHASALPRGPGGSS